MVIGSGNHYALVNVKPATHPTPREKWGISTDDL